MLKELYRRPDPTVLYTSPSQTLYIVVCIAGSAFMTLVSMYNWKNYQLGLEVNAGTYIAAAAIMTSFIWLTLALYCAYGPATMMKRIVLVPPPSPAAHSSIPRLAQQQQQQQQVMPKLRFEPYALALGKWPKPFEAELGSAYTDRPFASELDFYAKHRDQRRAPGVMEEFFSGVAKLLQATMKMFNRWQRFAYVRIEGRGQYKLDLRDCQTPDQGKSEFCGTHTLFLPPTSPSLLLLLANPFCSPQSQSSICSSSLTRNPRC